MYLSFLDAVTVAVLIRLGIILVLTFLFKNFIAKIIIKIIKKLLKPFKNETLNESVDSLSKTLSRTILIIGLYAALVSLPFGIKLEILFHQIFISCIYIMIISCVFIFMNTYEKIRKSAWNNMDQESAKTIMPLLIKIIKFCLIIFVIVAIANQFGFTEFDSLFAGLGIGGLAVAFAAQDMLKNIFGGFVVITDKSFNIGDYIKIGSVDGIVEELGIRSTRIRTLEKELVVVPNGTFADDAVINYSKRGTRRVKQYLGATYGTSSEKMQSVINRLKQSLVDNDDVVDSTIVVRFDGFGASSMDILVLYMVRTADYGEYLSMREKNNFEIMKIFEEEGVDFAFPSMSLYMEKN